jgi:hypothetical protein
MDGLEVDLSKTKYVHNEDLKQISSTIQTLLVESFGEDVKLETIAPGGFTLTSPTFPPDFGGDDILKFWAISPKPDVAPIQSEWKIVLYISKLSTGKAKKIAAQRPTHLLTRGGSAAMATSHAKLDANVDLSEPWRKLNGFNFKCMLLMSPALVDSLMDKVDTYEKLMSSQVKKFFTELCYSIHLQLLRQCEMPEFDHGGRTFKQMYQLNAKVS